MNNAGLVKKVSFPREILAAGRRRLGVGVLRSSSCVMVIFMAVLQLAAGLELPVPADRWHWCPLLVFASALAIFMAAINVYLRDTQHLIEVVLQPPGSGLPDRLLVRELRAPQAAAHGPHSGSTS